MGDALPEVSLGTDRIAVALVAGGERTCAILDSGELKCWGGNSDGQLGLEDTNPRGVSQGQMGDDLPAVALGTNRTAVAPALDALPELTLDVTPAPTGERNAYFWSRRPVVLLANWVEDVCVCVCVLVSVCVHCW